MKQASPFASPMAVSKGSTSPLLKMENLGQRWPQLEDSGENGQILEGQAVTAAKECLVATVRTDFLEALLKRL